MAQQFGSNIGATPAIPDQSGLIRLVSNKEINEIDKRVKDAEKEQNKPEMRGLAGTLWKYWEAAKNAKWQIDERLAKCIRQRKGIYDHTDLQAIRQFGGSEIFMMLTNVKCRSIEAQVKDIMLPAGEKPWSIDRTPIVDMPEEVVTRVTAQLQEELLMIMQEFGPDAQITPEMIDIRMAELMDEVKSEMNKIAEREMDEAELVVEDLLIEGGFYDQFADFVKDFSTYLTAFIRGPFIKWERRLTWKSGPDGRAYPDYESKPVMKFQRVSAFDIYPAPAARSLNDGYMFERMRIRPEELQQYKNSPGFSPKAIDQVLFMYRGGNLTNWLWTDQERANIENRPQEQTDPTTMMEALLFYGDIPYRELREYGIKIPDGDLADSVPVSCMMIGQVVVMVKINGHPLQWKPYYYASFDPSADSIWGNAPPELMEDCQRVCNAAARSMVNNMGLASGPQIEADYTRFHPADDIQRIWPWKVWRMKGDPTGHGRQAMQFFQPKLMVKELLEIFNFFYSQAGEQLGVPAYEHGVATQAGGAGKTAHGLSMLMTAASKIMKDAIGYIDRQVIKKIVFQTWLYAITEELLDYQGDINIVARASEYLIIAEQLQARRQEFLAFTNNPTDMAIIGIDGRAKVLEETVKSLKMDADKIVPQEWELAAKMGMLNTGPGAVAPEMPGGSPGGGPPRSEKPVAGEENDKIGGAPPTPPLQQMAQY